jgi:hypothetical protein
MALKLALLALLLATALGFCSCCSMNGFEVSQAQPAGNSALRISSLYSTSDVESHFKQMQKPNLVSNTQQGSRMTPLDNQPSISRPTTGQNAAGCPNAHLYLIPIRRL